MKSFTNLFRTGFVLAIFMGLGTLANAQSTTVTVTNNTSCAMGVEVYGWTSIGVCNVSAIANGLVNPGATVALTFRDVNTNNVVAANVTGAVSDPNNVPGVAGTNWQRAEKAVPGSNCAPTVTGYSPSCTGFNVNFTPTLDITID